MDPSSDMWFSQSLKARVNINDSGENNAWENLSESVSSDLSEGFGTQWNDWEDLWTGKENFLSNVISLNLDGKEQKVLPRDITFDVVTDEPIHVDFLRIVKGAKVILEIPVKFINHENSPGLKRGGVLNIVRRKVELKCPTENIPNELVVDLNGLEIGASIKISFVKLPENVTPTIRGRDFVIATIAAPTVVKEPEKPAEATEEAAAGTEGETAAEGEKTAAGDDKAKEAEKNPEKK